MAGRLPASNTASTCGSKSFITFNILISAAATDFLSSSDSNNASPTTSSVVVPAVRSKRVQHSRVAPGIVVYKRFSLSLAASSVKVERFFLQVDRQLLHSLLPVGSGLLRCLLLFQMHPVCNALSDLPL